MSVEVRGVRMQYDPPKSDSVAVDVRCFICGGVITTESSCWRGFDPSARGEVYAHLSCGEKYRKV